MHKKAHYSSSCLLRSRLVMKNKIKATESLIKNSLQQMGRVAYSCALLTLCAVLCCSSNATGADFELQ